MGMPKELVQRDSSTSTELGIIRINNEVIRTVAANAAQEVKGVHSLSGRFGRTLLTLITKKGAARGVKIIFEEHDIRLRIYINVEYGVDIPEVADKVQKNVKMAVEKMAGLTVSSVDVSVEGVRTIARFDRRQLTE